MPKSPITWVLAVTKGLADDNRCVIDDIFPIFSEFSPAQVYRLRERVVRPDQFVVRQSARKSMRRDDSNFQGLKRRINERGGK